MNVFKGVSKIIRTISPSQAAGCSVRYTSFKSALSLDVLYPTSNLKITTPSKPTTTQSPEFSGHIPIDQLEITYSKSSGPGGQNVNKLNTKVDVRVHVQSATWLSDIAKSKVLEKNESKLSKDGYLIFRSDITRSQQLNLADCLEKIRNCVRQALVEKPEPTAETLDRIRKRAERANIQRIAQKRIHGARKRENNLSHVEF